MGSVIGIAIKEGEADAVIIDQQPSAAVVGVRRREIRGALAAGDRGRRGGTARALLVAIKKDLVGVAFGVLPPRYCAHVSCWVC